MKLDQNYDCVFKIMSSTKITSSEFLKNKCYFHFPIDVCTHVVMLVQMKTILANVSQ